MTIAFQNFQSEAQERGQVYLQAMSRVLHSGWYILGPEVEAFEQEFSAYLGVEQTIGVANGLEALQITLLALEIGPGDEVITTPLSAIATTLAIEAVGATPVFADVDESGLLNPEEVKKVITSRTKAVIPVHLYGNSLDLQTYQELCQEHSLFLIEDAAQAHGAEYHGKKVGTVGAFGCWSFYPTKNLGAIGDGGALVTNDPSLAAKARKIRNYGQTRKYWHTEYGLNSRLDELQAAILRVKLGYLEQDLSSRRAIAERYQAEIKHEAIQPLAVLPKSLSARHLFVVRTKQRDQLQHHLLQAGISTLVHYPTLIPDQPVYGAKYKGVEIPLARSFVEEILSLPIHPFLREEEVSYIIKTINSFLE